MVSPCPAEHLEGVGADAAGPVVGRAHDELGPGGDGAELADNEPVPELRIVEQDVVLFKPRRVHRIVVVGVIPDLDVRGRHHIFDIAGCAVFVWKNRVGVRKPHAADGLIHDVSSCFLFTASTTSSPGGLPQPPHASF